MKPKFYSLRNILAKDAQYNVIFGERSNGKTYSVLKYGLEQFTKNDKQLAIVRRWKDDFTGKRGATMFDAVVANGEVEKLTGGDWTGVYYFGSRWYLCKHVDGQRVTSDVPFAYGFSISSMEHDKSTAYPDITTVMFDEFLTRSTYLPDEFVLFMNVLSTIIRHRTDVKIFMLGNTVNRSCPYFAEMGLTHIKEQAQGTVDVYHYGSSGLEVIAEYCSATAKRGGKKSDVYFAFDNPELQMITQGAWEIAIYPHKPCNFKPKDIQFIFFIEFENDLLQCECVMVDDGAFIFVHRKTGEIKYPDSDIVYTTRPSEKWNYRMCLTHQHDKFSRNIIRMIAENRVFYADNEVGEIMRNYLIWSDSYNIKN